MKRSIFTLTVVLAVGSLLGGACATPEDVFVAEPDVHTADVSQVVPESDSSHPTPKPKADAGMKKDAAKADSGSEGDPCPSGVTSEVEACGKCGTRSRVCVASGEGGSVWAAWGSCGGEVQGADSCEPGAALADVSCGNCGTKNRVCGSDCRIIDGSCIEPVFGSVPACAPGTTEFKLGASCSGANEGRSHQCLPTCAWGSYGACEAPPENPNFVAVNVTVGAINKKTFSFSKDTVSGLTAGACPTSIDTGSPVSYSHVLLKNMTGKTAKVSVWSSLATGKGAATIFFNQMTIYPTPFAHVMLEDNQRTACKGTVNDGCIASVCKPDNLAGLVVAESHGIVLAPGATVTVYTEADLSGSSGSYVLNVKTESLQ